MISAALWEMLLAIFRCIMLIIEGCPLGRRGGRKKEGSFMFSIDPLQSILFFLVVFSYYLQQ